MGHCRSEYRSASRWRTPPLCGGAKETRSAGAHVFTMNAHSRSRLGLRSGTRKSFHCRRVQLRVHRLWLTSSWSIASRAADLRVMPRLERQHRRGVQPADAILPDESVNHQSDRSSDGVLPVDIETVALGTIPRVYRLACRGAPMARPAARRVLNRRLSSTQVEPHRHQRCDRFDDAVRSYRLSSSDSRQQPPPAAAVRPSQFVHHRRATTPFAPTFLEAARSSRAGGAAVHCGDSHVPR